MYILHFLSFLKQKTLTFGLLRFLFFLALLHRCFISSEEYARTTHRVKQQIKFLKNIKEEYLKYNPFKNNKQEGPRLTSMTKFFSGLHFSSALIFVTSLREDIV